MWNLLSRLFPSRTEPRGLKLDHPRASSLKPSSIPISAKAPDGPKLSESDLQLLAIIEAKDREIDQTMAKPLEAQLADLRAYRSRDGALTFASTLGRIGERHTNANGFQLLMRLYREANESAVVKALPQTLVRFDMSLLETEFDVRQIAKMAMGAFPTFNPTIGQYESRYDPVARQFVALPTTTRPGWDRVAAIIYDELAEPALKDLYDWSGHSVEALLLALGSRGVALAADRVNGRPTRINPGGEAGAYWAAAIRLLGKGGGHEHLVPLEKLAAAVGLADPAISEGCRRAIESIRARVGTDAAYLLHQTGTSVATDAPRVTRTASTEQASQPTATINKETKVEGIVRRVVEHLRTWGVAPTTECWNDGNTCNINVVVDGAHYKIQIMDPTEFQTIAWRLVNGEEITLGTAENASPTDIDRRIDQICRQVDQGRFNA